MRRMVNPKKARTPPRAKTHLSRQVWLDTARQALIEEGTAGVEINKLAKRLSSSRSSFYWFFKDRAELLDELLKCWRQTGTVLFENILKLPDLSGMDKYLAVTSLWIEEKEYQPKWDGAIRDWARISEAVRKVVHLVDQRRIAVLEKIFKEIGYAGKDAHIRARVMYYHQVGYYAMGVQESRRQRRALIPYYRRALTGRDG
jgi:AcrR family transcriptional regulator